MTKVPYTAAGLPQIAQLGPGFCLGIPIRGLNFAHDSSQRALWNSCVQATHPLLAHAAPLALCAVALGRQVRVPYLAYRTACTATQSLWR
jgi:hypothetical protein